MSLHRLLCALGVHWFAAIGDNRRGCAVCFQHQRYVDTPGGGVWINLLPTGRVG